jgi:hypothetical protein
MRDFVHGFVHEITAITAAQTAQGGCERRDEAGSAASAE